MNHTLRPSMSAEDFQQKVSPHEQALMVTAIEEALKYTFERDGAERCIASFRLMYSGVVFTRVWRFIDEAFAKLEGWRIKRSGFTFILVKDGVCQFHFYKGNRDFPFKAETQRQKSIVFGQHYSDLEDLPSVIIRHYSDKLSINLIGVDALFFDNGKQEDAIDIMNKHIFSSPSIKLGEFSITKAQESNDEEEAIRIVAKKTRAPRKNKSSTQQK